MDKSRKSKKSFVLTELSKRIKHGEFRPGESFPSMSELMLQYKISFGTASKVIHDLKELGLIDASKGRRSRIPDATATLSPKLLKPIGVISPKSEPFRLSRWRDVILQLIQRKSMEGNNQSLWLPENFDVESVKSNYAGIIYSGEIIPAEQWQRLMELNIPCARISFDRPYKNTIFVDYRPAIDQVVLHMAKSNCHKMIYMSPSELENEGCEKWLQNHARFTESLIEYGIEDRVYMYVLPHQNIGAENLFMEISKSKSKIAFVAGCNSYASLIMQLTEKCGMEIHRDFEFYSFSFIENEMCIGNNIDLKYSIVTGKMLDMFYRQCITGEVQFGETVFAEFIPKNRI